jgi:hypothetical protein
MERILIKRTKRDLKDKEDLSFYRIELRCYDDCFMKFFEDKEKLKYNQFEKVEIVDKKVVEIYLKWEDKHIYKK